MATTAKTIFEEKLKACKTPREVFKVPVPEGVPKEDVMFLWVKYAKVSPVQARILWDKKNICKEQPVSRLRVNI